jgi:hypothetical protein
MEASPAPRRNTRNGGCWVKKRGGQPDDRCVFVLVNELGARLLKHPGNGSLLALRHWMVAKAAAEPSNHQTARCRLSMNVERTRAGVDAARKL